MPSLDQFIADGVPARSSLASAILEYAALQRSLDVRRFNRQIVLVRIGGVAVPFHGINGPDTSETAYLMRGRWDILYTLLAARGVPVPKWSVFTTEQRKAALSYARGLGWPVTVRPARTVKDDGATSDVTGTQAFRAAWQASVDATTRTRSAHSTVADAVLVREQVAGRNLQVFVVAGRAAAVTELVAAPSKRVVNLDTLGDDPITAVAVRAVGALPGMAYGSVHVTVPEPDDRDTSEGAAVVTYADCSAVPAAQFPTAGEPCDVAGAVLDHYLDSPRWVSARATPHGTGTAGTPHVEPLYLGHS